MRPAPSLGNNFSRKQDNLSSAPYGSRMRNEALRNNFIFLGFALSELLSFKQRIPVVRQ
jgi:hypothetical protein